MGCSSSSATKTELPKELNLFLEPYKLGSIQLKNRFVMAAMTRCRGDAATGVPNDLMAEYYAQRASFGLILTECSQISPLSNAFPGSGGIYSKEQVEGWKKVTQKVHEKGGKIVLQIWHSGRAVLSEFIGGEKPLAPSAIAIRTPHSYTKGPHPEPKEMTHEDIKQVIQQFKVGAQNAKEAGFDGIQLHGANGYLVDQFLKDGTNKRTDEYGGSIENRAKFLLECIDVLIEVFGADKVGIKLSPTGRYNDMYDYEPLETTKYVLKELEKKKIAFVEIKRHGPIDGKSESDVDQFGQKLPAQQIPDFLNVWRPIYNGHLILNDGIDYQTGLELLKTKKTDLISFATLAISNPDLPERLKNGWALSTSDYKTYFSPGKEGYTDYPVYSPPQSLQKPEEKAEKKEEHHAEKADQKHGEHDQKKNEEHHEKKHEEHHEKKHEEHHENKHEEHHENKHEEHHEKKDHEEHHEKQHEEHHEKKEHSENHQE